ncbi:uncharacterized protein [Watersipora subatra]|uniref:uncharacterized protein n=1 Tax=Watersipora subatra TaxID=2589382 RepID=UPI00355AECBE
MSPHRLPERESGTKQPITPETEAYIRQSEFKYDSGKNMPTHPTPSPPSTIKFDESWPSSEQPSSIYSTVTKGPSPAETTSPSTDESVLSKYLRRFRNDPPLRRQDRKAPSLHEFWWGSNNLCRNTEKAIKKASSNSVVSTQSSARTTGNTSSDHDFELSSDGTPRSSGSKPQMGKRITFEPTTPKTKALTERADELLSNSDLTEVLTSLPAMSTINSESSSGTSAVVYHSTPEEDTIKPSAHRGLTTGINKTSRNRTAYRQFAVHHTAADTLDPNNDILYQWRLKRRLEKAQERVKNAELQAALPQTRGHLDGPRQHGKAQLKHTFSSKAGLTEPSSSSLHMADQLAQESFSVAGEKLKAVRTTVVERVVQTDKEIVQSGTQTTPTVDPISACTGLATEVSTRTLRDRIAASTSPIQFSAAGCSAMVGKSCCVVHARHQSGYQQCCRGLDRQQCCHELDRHLCCHDCSQPERQLSSDTPERRQLSQSHSESPNTNNNCLAEISQSRPSVFPATSDKTVTAASNLARKKCVPSLNSGETHLAGPEATAVSKAISEVCKQRLFDVTHSPDATISQTLAEPLSPSPALTHEESSGDEFVDDELLSALRQKRQEMEGKLKEVERRLLQLARGAS